LRLFKSASLQTIQQHWHTFTDWSVTSSEASFPIYFRTDLSANKQFSVNTAYSKPLTKRSAPPHLFWICLWTRDRYTTRNLDPADSMSTTRNTNKLCRIADSIKPLNEWQNPVNMFYSFLIKFCNSVQCCLLWLETFKLSLKFHLFLQCFCLVLISWFSCNNCDFVQRPWSDSALFTTLYKLTILHYITLQHVK